MQINNIIVEGLLQPILEDNGIKLKRHELELIDIINTGNDTELQEWIAQNGNKFEKCLNEIVCSMVMQLAENSPQYIMFCNKYCSYDDTNNSYFFEGE